jgi:hypothetical protein
VVKKIEEGPTGANDRPQKPVTVTFFWFLLKYFTTYFQITESGELPMDGPLTVAPVGSTVQDAF